jgi:hypothetical protein
VTRVHVPRQVECAEALARAGCDVGVKDKKGRIGRELAEVQGHAEMVARLRAVCRGAWARVTIDQFKRLALQTC